MASNSFPDNVAPEFRKEIDDWSVTFNPKVERQLDIRLLYTIPHNSTVCCIRFSPDGEQLAAACSQAVNIYKARTGEKICTLSYEPFDTSDDIYVRGICYSRDGKLLAGGGEDKMIRIWDIAEGKVIHTYEGHTEDVYSVAFTPDGKYLISGSGDHTTKVWDMADGSSRTFVIPDVPQEVDTGVTTVIVSSDQRLVITAGIDSVIRIWDFGSGELLESIRGHTDSVYGLELSPDNRGLLSGSLDQDVKYWDISRWVDRVNGGTQKAINGEVSKSDKAGDIATPAKTFSGNKEYVLTASKSRDWKWIASGSKDCRIQFWDFETATPQMVLQAHTNAIISVELSPIENILATGAGDWELRVWDYSPASQTSPTGSAERSRSEPQSNEEWSSR